MLKSCFMTIDISKLDYPSFVQQDFIGKTVIPFMTNGGWPGHVIKDMEAECKGAKFAHEMKIQFDSTGGDRLETPERVITKWVADVKKDLN